VEPRRPVDRLLSVVARGVVALLFHLSVVGAVPPPGSPLIVAANHVSYLDPLVLGVVVLRSGRLPRFLVTPGVLRVPVLGAILRRSSVFPADRDGLAAAAAALEAGGTVVVYPEGHVARPGRRFRAKLGIAALARRTGAPVLPVAQAGIERGGRLAWVRRRRAAVLVGKQREPTAEEERALADAVVADIEAMLPEARAISSGLRIRQAPLPP
jgi:1-acyl-sn-glycerol-3-phosphate acyltransferase